MSDDPITQLNVALEGRYRIERELGEGGMATVYLADDIKHERKVALKVLKPELAAVIGAERFLAEIKTTANLQHPHILPLFDSGEADSFLFYVMPYVVGESLREKLDRERQLPVDDAVRIASDVAEALDHAHRQGVVHRDIKPGNILLSERGEPLVADFGIALAVSAGGGGLAGTDMTSRLTETGMSIGSPHYMSPEQVTGDRNVGPATDIYALGCVVYEMLVGEPPFRAVTPQASLGKIIIGKFVSAVERRASVPTNVDATIRKALEKLPADRFASAQDFATALTDPGFRHGELADVGAAAGVGPWNRLTVTFASLFVLAAGLAAVSIIRPFGPSEPPAPEVVRFTVQLGQDADTYLGLAMIGRSSRTSLAFSPDGDLLVYSGAKPGEGFQLYLQRFDQERAEPIEGTEGAVFPFSSPDGAWIGFVRGGSLWRVSVADGDVERIVERLEDATEAATWGDDGTIVFASDGDLFRVAATGGEPESVAEPDLSRISGAYFQPHMLPGSEVVLAHLATSPDPEQSEIVALDLTTGAQKIILLNAMDPRYVETGHLLFMRQGTLMAVAFDPKLLEVQGQPVIMVEDVMHAIYMLNTDIETGAAQLAVSASGHLAYALGGVYPEQRRIAVRVTGAGDTIPLGMDRSEYINFRVSPGGDRIASTVRPRGSQNIAWHDLAQGVTQRLNNRAFNDLLPLWSPDGRWLAFNSERDGVATIYRRSVDGGGEPERLTSSDEGQYVMSWSSKGSWHSPN